MSAASTLAALLGSFARALWTVVRMETHRPPYKTDDIIHFPSKQMLLEWLDNMLAKAHTLDDDEDGGVTMSFRVVTTSCGCTCPIRKELEFEFESKDECVTWLTKQRRMADALDDSAAGGGQPKMELKFEVSGERFWYI
jgi:hypothetical protein